MQLADSFAEGHGYTGLKGSREDFIAPLFPALVAGLSLLRLDAMSTTVGAARAVSVTCGALLALAVFSISTRVYGRLVGWIAGCAIATAPLLVHLSAIALPDTTMLTLATAGTVLAAARTRVASRVCGALAGACYGLAILTRPESVITLLVSVIAFAVLSRQGWRFTTVSAVVTISVAVLIAAGLVLSFEQDLRVSMLPNVTLHASTVSWAGTFRGLSFPLLIALAAGGVYPDPRHRTTGHDGSSCARCWAARWHLALPRGRLVWRPV